MRGGPVAITHIHVTGYGHDGTIGRMRLLLSKLGNISEQHRRCKVPFDVRLLERLNLAREDMVECERLAVLLLDCLGDHVEGKQRRLGTASHELLMNRVLSLAYEHIVATRSLRPLS